MRHRQTKTKLGNHRSVRRSLEKNLMRSLISHGRIQTTEARAKAIKPLVERLITVGKKPSISARRTIIARTGSRTAATRLLETIGPRYAERNGGYTRIVKLGKRRGDGAATVLLEFV